MQTPPQPALPADAQPPVRFGLVDMGSNAIRLQIVELVTATGEVRTLESHRAPVRLGRDVFMTGFVPPDVIDAAVDSLARFRESCTRLGVVQIEAIATSAMREAQNRNEVLERIRAATDIVVRVVSGSEESYLLTAAVRSRLDLTHGRSLLVDLGGGSVEVSILDAGEVVYTDSYRLGALRVLHALDADDGDGDPHGASFLQLLDDYVAAVEGRIRDHFGEVKIDRYVATGGNIETLADLAIRAGGARRDGEIDAVPLEFLKDLTGRLAMLSYRERMEQFDLRPDRADTILPAAVVYYRIGRAARAEVVLAPRVGMRDGLLQELLSGYVRHSREADRREALIAASHGLGRRYRYDERHAEAVRRLALEVFDATRPLHGLGALERTMLEVGALLHDIGVFVNNSKHHKHSWYLIRESELIGLTDAEREIVALVARYHRRAHPTRKHWGWAGLTAEDQRRVHRLAAILRLCDGLDRGHQDKIAHLQVAVTRSTLELRPVLAAGFRASDLALERLGLDDKGRLFQEVFGRRVRLLEPLTDVAAGGEVAEEGVPSKQARR
ncbi:MAG: Ppx/GppA family phosphatase [Planctomycetes bacterium]|nr:Ppx/GppA family phosphatase [Planctomycetota bacterium]